MENYLFYEPLQKLKQTVDSGALGSISGYHMKMWRADAGLGSAGRFLRVAFPASRDGRGQLLFDDGWHKLSTALWLFGRSRKSERGSVRRRSFRASKWTRRPR